MPNMARVELAAVRSAMGLVTAFPSLMWARGSSTLMSPQGPSACLQIPRRRIVAQLPLHRLPMVADGAAPEYLLAPSEVLTPRRRLSRSPMRPHCRWSRAASAPIGARTVSHSSGTRAISPRRTPSSRQGSAKATMASPRVVPRLPLPPAAITTYCLPFSDKRNVIGAACPPAGRDPLQSSCPVSTSKARR